MDHPECGDCGSVHGIISRSHALDHLVDQWVSNQHWFIPVVGERLVRAATYLAPIAEALYLDGGPEIGEVMLISSGAMNWLASDTADTPKETLDNISGIYTIPRSATTDQLSAAFPGHFAEKEEPPAERILMLVDPCTGDAGVAPLILDVLALADPEMADKVVSALE